MSSFRIQVKSAAGSWTTKEGVGTIIPDAGFNYSDKLSEVNEANINVSGTGEVKRALIEIGSEIKIWRNDALDFHGLVNFIDYLEGGGISIHAKGYEWWLGLENGAYAGSPWTSTASATIFSAVIGESNYFTAGTINTGTSVDYRAEGSDSLWNVIRDLTEATAQDIGIDYPNLEVDILDHKGSATSVATFNAGLQIGNIRITHNYPLGNKVIVYGKSEGETRITSEYPGHGYDSGSQTSYGVITKIIRDPKITTVVQANILADAEVARLKDPVKVYDFEVMNPNQSVVAGDVITLNARSQGVTNEDVRIVGIERGVSGGVEYLTLQVTNAEYAKLMRTVEETMAKIDKDFRTQQTYDEYQDEYTNQVNTVTSIGGIVDVYPSYFDFGGYELFNTPGLVSLTEDVYFQSNYNGLYVTYATGRVYLFNDEFIDADYGRIINVATPTASGDAATKGYVDGIAGGFTSYQATDTYVSNIPTSWTDLGLNLWITTSSADRVFLTFSCSLDADTSGEYFQFRFIAAGAEIGLTRYQEPSGTGTDEGLAQFHYVHNPGAGSRFYRVQARTSDGSGDISECVFIALKG